MRGVPIVAQQKWTRPVSMRRQVRSLAPFSGLRIRDYCELWCRSQIWLRFCVAVAVVYAHSCNSVSPLPGEFLYAASVALNPPPAKKNNNGVRDVRQRSRVSRRRTFKAGPMWKGQSPDWTRCTQRTRPVQGLRTQLSCSHSIIWGRNWMGPWAEQQGTCQAE